LRLDRECVDEPTGDLDTRGRSAGDGRDDGIRGQVDRVLLERWREGVADLDVPVPTVLLRVIE